MSAFGEPEIGCVTEFGRCVRSVSKVIYANGLRLGGPTCLHRLQSWWCVL